MDTDVPIGIKLRRVEASFKFYSVKHIKIQDLKELSQWPKFSDPHLSWANFSATTSSLQSRWYQSSVKAKVAWLVIRDDEGKLIARSSLTQPEDNQQLVFGIVIRSDMTDRGIGTEITQGVMRLVFEIANPEGIWLESHHKNKRARRVWEKIGFEFVSYHYRRSTLGEMDKFAAYQFPASKKNQLPEIQINKF